MRVDFDSLRKSVARNYNCLIRSLNTDIQPSGEIYTNLQDLRQYTEDLRVSIGTLLLLQGEADEEIRDISDEVKLIELSDLSVSDLSGQ